MLRLDQPQSVNLDSLLGVPGGIASLNLSGQIPLSQLPLLTSSGTSAEFLGADGVYRVITLPSHTYSMIFQNSSLVSGALTVTHDLSSFVCEVVIADENNKFVQPDSVTYLTDNSLSVGLTSFSPLSGTWRATVIGTEEPQFDILP